MEVTKLPCQRKSEPRRVPGVRKPRPARKQGCSVDMAQPAEGAKTGDLPCSTWGSSPHPPELFLLGCPEALLRDDGTSHENRILWGDFSEGAGVQLMRVSVWAGLVLTDTGVAASSLLRNHSSSWQKILHFAEVIKWEPELNVDPILTSQKKKRRKTRKPLTEIEGKNKNNESWEYCVSLSFCLSSGHSLSCSLKDTLDKIRV